MSLSYIEEIVTRASQKFHCNATKKEEQGKLLNGHPPNSGPLDVATKTSFPLFFVGGKGLVHIYQNHFN